MKLSPTRLLLAFGVLALAQSAEVSADRPQPAQAAFQAWDESDLRAWLLQHGIVAPKTKKEELVLLADKSWSDMQAAASSLSAGGASGASSAHAAASRALSSSLSSASSLYSSYSSVAAKRGSYDASRLYWSASSASKAASKSANQAYTSASSAASSGLSSAWKAAQQGAGKVSSDVSSAAGGAHKALTDSINDSTDWVWSTWNDNQLRSYLEKHGVIKTPTEAKRDQLLAAVKDTYTKTANAPYEAFSDSYLHNWLVDHGVIRSPEQKTRDEYIALANKYYYGTQDAVWNSWSDSDVRSWLIDNGVLSRSEAEKSTPEKLRERLAGAYGSSKDYLYRGWTESDLRSLLVAAGVLEPLKPGELPKPQSREEYIQLLEAHGRSLIDSTAHVLSWSDQHLRSYLASAGLAPKDIESYDRDRLLRETRSRLTEAGKETGGFFESALWRAKEVARHVLESVQGAAGSVEDAAAKKQKDAAASASAASKTASRVAASASAEASKRLKEAKEDL